MSTVTSITAFIDQVFQAKPKEKRDAWALVLQNEEYDTVEALQSASDAAWAALPLPLAIKDQLHAAISLRLASADLANSSASSQPAVVGDTRPLTQLDVIVFDISVSMNSKSCDPENTRLGAAKILFHTMVDKLVGHECPHSLGLVLFGNNMKWNTFTRDYESFHDTLGCASADEFSTKLYDAVRFAGEKIIEFRESNADKLSPAGCKFRIFCLTDGEDNASRNQYWEVAKFLRENNIVLDSIPLGTTNDKLQRMAGATGGLALRVLDMQKGASLFEREPVIRLSCRDEVSLPEITSEASLTGLTVQVFEDVKSSVPKAMQQKVMSATEIAAMQQQLNSPVAAAASSNGHNRRILKEFKSLMDEPVEGISCYITAGNIHFWKLIVEGPKDTPYFSGRYMTYLEFPRDYPFKAPSFRFATPIFHPNVNNDGKICLDVLHGSWSPAITASKVLTEVISLIKNPNPADALDTVKAGLYSDNKAEFTRQAVAHTLAYASSTLEELVLQYNLS